MRANPDHNMKRTGSGARPPVRRTDPPADAAAWDLLQEILLGDTLARLQELDGKNSALQNKLAEREQFGQAALQRLRDENQQLREAQKQLAATLALLKTNLEDKEALLASLQPVIADLLERKIADAGEEMAEIVAPLMGPAIKKQVGESKDEIVEALYPVIGQTVRRAVAEAMRKLVREINARLDKAFKWQGTWARLRARLAGMPPPVAVIPHVFPFTVEQIFLIDQRTGLLLLHEAQSTHADFAPDEKNGREENGGPEQGKPQMIGGMLTAIQDFVKDAFGAAQAGDLQEIKYADQVIFIAASPPVFLAAVTQGAAPLQFPERLRGFLRRLYNAFHQSLRAFAGDTSELERARPVLQNFITACNAPALAAPRREPAKMTPATWRWAAWGGAGALALAAALWFGIKSWRSLAEPLGGTVPVSLVPGTTPFRVEMRTSGEVWLRLVIDAGDSTDFRFQPGETHAWRAYNRLRMRVGNAGQTELFLEGRNLGYLGQRQQPVTLVIARDGIVEKHY